MATDLSKWVREARDKAKLTQAQLGEKLSVTKGNVSAWETGKHEPSFAQLEAIESISGHPLPRGGVVAEPPASYAETLEISSTDWTLLTAFQDLPEDERQELLNTAMAKAEKYRAYAAQVLAKHTTAGPAPDARVAENIRPAPRIEPAPQAVVKVKRQTHDQVPARERFLGGRSQLGDLDEAPAAKPKGRSK